MEARYASTPLSVALKVLLDIVIESPLPLDPYLAKGTLLSLKLTTDGITAYKSSFTNGDLKTGKWAVASRFDS